MKKSWIPLLVFTLISIVACSGDDMAAEGSSAPLEPAGRTSTVRRQEKVSLADEYHRAAKDFDPYLERLSNLSADERDVIWKEVARGRFVSFDNVFGDQAKQARSYIDKIKLVEGFRSGDYPSADHFKDLFDAWNGRDRFFGLMDYLEDYSPKPNFRFRFGADSGMSDGVVVQPGQLVEKGWMIQRTLGDRWPRDLVIQPVFQRPRTIKIEPQLLDSIALGVKNDQWIVTFKFQIPEDMPEGPWECYFVTSTLNESGKRQFLQPKPELLFESEELKVEAMQNLLHMKLIVQKKS